MAGYVLHLSEQENITLSAAVTRRLIDGGDGDAVLLYLCLLKNRGSASPETLRAELKWDEARRWLVCPGWDEMRAIRARRAAVAFHDPVARSGHKYLSNTASGYGLQANTRWEVRP